MNDNFAVIVVEDGDSCTVKKVHEELFEEINYLVSEGEDESIIVSDLVDIRTNAADILVSNVSRAEAVEVATDEAGAYVLLHAD